LDDGLEEKDLYVIDYNLTTKGTEYADTALGENSIVGDPGFLDPSAGDFRLSSQSMARMKGSLDYRAATDIAGNERAPQKKTDLGAHANPPESE